VCDLGISDARTAGAGILRGDAVSCCRVWRPPKDGSPTCLPLTGISKDCDRLAGSGAVLDELGVRSLLFLLHVFFFEGGGGKSCRPMLTGLSDIMEEIITK
jgi:hypothetical protein